MFASNTSQVSSDATYIEDVFSTWLYTGNGSTQTITNGIDLAGQGGLTWIKKRNAAEDHILTDTVRGAGNTLFSNLTSANEYDITRLSAFTSSGFSVGTSFRVNQSSNTYASWTFRKQPKFFDVVTYTGNGTSQNIAHNLGSVPGCIIVKSTSTVNDWRVYHRSLATVDSALRLNSTAAAGSSSTFWNSTAPTSTQFTVGSDGSVNANGATYVAYLFAHNAGGFGLTGTDNVISCGSYTGNGSATGPVINLGFEPQWVLIKNASAGWNWKIVDVMRGMALTNTVDLEPNTSGAENAPGVTIYPTATGFTVGTSSSTWNGNGNTIIYIAIRRGPMKTPTSGTSVFSPEAFTGDATSRTIGSITTDLLILRERASDSWDVTDRLRGTGYSLVFNSTAAEANNSASNWPSFNKTQLGVSYTGAQKNQSGTNYIDYLLRRAPGFFDEVCYTGDATGTKAIAHNLGVAPELYIVKGRTGSPTYGWYVYSAALGNTKSLVLNTTAAAATTTWTWDSTSPTATSFYVTSDDTVGGAGRTYVAYLFASCPGVSKVGSYTGTGATQTINCGFTGGARWVLIKRTDSTGDWYVWDTARGMVSGTDPSLLLNSTAAEVNANSVYTTSVGFQIVSTAAGINASGGTYIYLAIA